MVDSPSPLDQLNPQQLAAVTCPLGTTLVLAGPGSGKTRVLTQRVTCLVEQHGVDPRSILAVTFTNKAAREMRSRLERALGDRASDVTLGTFHSVCVRILRREAERFGIQRSFAIYDRDDQVAMIKRVLKELNADDKQYRPPAVLAAISKAKNDMIGPEDYRPPTYWHEVVARAYDAYQRALVANNALDFDDLLLATVQGLRERPDVLAAYRSRYRHLLVDEFQDTNLPQYELIRLLSDADTDLFLVGDEDQSIYGWRGADYRNLNRARQAFPGMRSLLLEHNYRSTQNILDAAKAVIAQNPKRVPKDLRTEQGAGEPVVVREAFSTDEEAEFVVSEMERLVATGKQRLPDFAVMYRMNAQSRALEEAFLRHGLPYRLLGGTRFYQRREIKDVLAYLRLISTRNEWVAFERVVNVPTRGLGAVSLNHLRELGRELSAGPYDTLRYLQDVGSGDVALTGRARNALLQFLETWDEVIGLVESSTVADLIGAILSYFGYRSYLAGMGPEGEERLENVDELYSVAREHFTEPGAASLSGFLDEVALVADVDDLEEVAEAPVLMTLHSAKGLEFPVVFIVGLQEGVLPHSRSLEEAEGLEEERRLLYVGMTRAMERLYLLHSATSRMYGMEGPAEPSRFLKDIPPQLTAAPPEPPRASRRATTRAPGTSRQPETQAPPPDLPRYSTGDQVIHAKFGKGIVVEYKIAGGDAEVSVAFEGHGIKRLLVSLAPLTPA